MGRADTLDVPATVVETTGAAALGVEPLSVDVSADSVCSTTQSGGGGGAARPPSAGPLGGGTSVDGAESTPGGADDAWGDSLGMHEFEARPTRRGVYVQMLGEQAEVIGERGTKVRVHAVSVLAGYV